MKVGQVFRDYKDSIEWESISYRNRNSISKMKYVVRFRKRPEKWIATSRINDEEKLATYVRNHYGFGEFVLLFYSPLVKNKRYSATFLCTKYKTKTCPFVVKCNKFKDPKKNKPGMVCRRNPKLMWNWKKKAQVIINKIEDPTSCLDFNYRFDKIENKMLSYQWWLGKTNKASEKEFNQNQIKNENELFTAPPKNTQRDEFSKYI